MFWKSRMKIKSKTKILTSVWGNQNVKMTSRNFQFYQVRHLQDCKQITAIQSTGVSLSQWLSTLACCSTPNCRRDSMSWCICRGHASITCIIYVLRVNNLVRTSVRPCAFLCRLLQSCSGSVPWIKAPPSYTWQQQGWCSTSSHMTAILSCCDTLKDRQQSLYCRCPTLGTVIKRHYPTWTLFS